MSKEQIKETKDLDDKNVIAEDGGASEGSLTPGGGTGSGDIKTKTIADIVAKLGSLGPDDLNGFKASIDQIGKEADPVPGGAEGKNRKSVETKPSHASVKGVIKEDLSKLFESEQGDEVLSEEFIENAMTLFESAVTLRVADEVEQIEATLQEDVETTLNETRQSYVDRMDSYLDYVAEQFIENNRVALESQVRAEINEAFVSDIRQVFESHNLELPESDFDTVASLQEQLEELKGQLNESVTNGIGLEQELVNRDKAEVLTGVMEGLTDSQKDKMTTLAEDIDFEDADQFREKVSTIKESFFADAGSGDNGLILEEDGVTDPAAPKATPEGPMGDYIKAISRSLKK